MSPYITKKTSQTIQSGDIFRTEYGDFDNYCNFVFVDCKPDGRCTCITVHHVGSDDNFNIYDLLPIDRVTFDVIGKEG